MLPRSIFVSLLLMAICAPAAARQADSDRWDEVKPTAADVEAEAIFGRARGLEETGRLPEARTALEEVIRGAFEQRWKISAHLNLARLAHSMQDDAAMVEHLRAVADAPQNLHISRNIMEMAGSRQIAIRWLGDHYRSQGDFEAALHYYRQFTPGGGCGTCMREQMAASDVRIAQVYIEMGRPEAALDEHIRPMFFARSHYSSPALPALAVSVARDIGRLDGLVEELENPAQGAQLSGLGRITLALARIEQWRLAGDVHRLIAEFWVSARRRGAIQPSAGSDWRQIAAAGALWELGDPARDAIERRLEALLKDAPGDAAEPRADEMLWHIRTLAQSNEHAARHYLVKFKERFPAEQQAFRALGPLPELIPRSAPAPSAGQSPP